MQLLSVTVTLVVVSVVVSFLQENRTTRAIAVIRVFIYILFHADKEEYSTVALNQEFVFAAAPSQAIMPIPVSIAFSSMLKSGVCTPAVIPFALLAVPSRKKQPGIF